MGATPNPLDAYRLACRYARSMVRRFDIEVESEANYAAALALQSWEGLGEFSTYLHRFVRFRLKRWRTDMAIRLKRQTAYTDMSNNALYDAHAAPPEPATIEVSPRVMRLLLRIGDGMKLRTVEDSEGWRHGTGLERLREMVGST